MELDDVQLAKLTIEPYADQEFTRLAGPPWQALFNPTELGFSRKNQYNTTPSAGSSQPQTSYGGGQPDEVTIDLFFDGTGVVESLLSVSERVNALLELTSYKGDAHQPYYLHVHWGRFDFRGVLTQADVTYTLFDRSGEPLRATVKITLQKAVAPQPLAAEEGNSSPDLYQSWLVKEGQRLEHIAFSVYGSADFWRPLATANGLRNPRTLVAGQTLVLPPLAPGERMSDRFPTAATPDRPELEVSLDGTALAPLVQRDIVEVDASEEIGRHARLTLLVQNWDADKQAVRHSDGALFAPGRAISLRLGYHAKLEPVFDGVITALGGHFSAGSGPTLRIEARSRSIQLAYPPRSRLLEQANDGDIAGAIAADYGLTADADDGIDQDFVVIDGRSDWEHLTERAAALGWVTYVRDKTLVFKPPAQPPGSPPELAWGRNLTELHLTQDLAAVADPIVATSWDPDGQQAADGQAGASRSTVPSGGRQAVDGALSDAGWPLREQHVPLTTPLPLPELEQLAVGQATADALRHFTGRGATIGLPSLRADSWASITGVGKRMSGSHYLSAVRHRMSARGYVTEFQLGRGQPLQPPAAAAADRPSLRLAVVQDLDDPEKWGRVKVALPYRSDAPDALWARIATLDAGPRQGTWFIPDVGQEVVIGTLGDDDRHPVVLGALWNGQQSPPEQMDPQKNDIRAIVTRAGHKIRFDDGDPATVEVSTAGGRTVLLDDGNSAVEVKEPDGPSSMKLSGSGIELTAKAGDIKLTASAGKLIVDATGIEAKSSGAAKLESSATLDVKASAKLTLSGGMVAIN